MAFRFYLDGQLTDAPMNEFDLSTSIERVNDTQGINITQDVQLQYNGNNNLNPFESSGYQILLNAFESGTCNELLLDIYDEITDTQTIHVYQGVIKVPSITWDLQKAIISTKVQDNSYYAYLSNNQSIEYNFLSPASKNGVTITPATQTTVVFFNPITCTYNSLSPHEGININDAFEFIVRALSDNKISFYSYTLKQEPVLFLFTGYALQVANSGDPSELITSFETLFNEVKKVRNIGYYIDRTDLNNPVMIIEDMDLMYGNSNVFEFTDIKDMVSEVNTDNIYAIIKVGSKELADGANPNYTFPEAISYLGFKPEDYVPLGQCNFDNELDLINDYVISSNMISDQIYGAVTTNLDKVFMVECEYDTGSMVWLAKKYPSWVGQGTCFYNQGLNNPSKLQVQNSSYQAASTNTLANGTYGFRAELGAEQTVGSFNPGSSLFSSSWAGATTEPVIFVDENSGVNYDGSGNYNNTTGIYLAPVSGNYSFNSEIPIRIADCDTVSNCVIITVAGSQSPSIAAGTYKAGSVRQQFVGKLSIKVYTDNTLSSLVSQTQSQVTFAYNGTYSISNNFVGYLAAGNAVVVSLNIRSGLFVYNVTTNATNTPVNWPNPDISALNNSGWSIFLGFSGCSFPQPYGSCYARTASYFECNGMPDGIVTFGSSDPKLFQNKTFEFEYDINTTDFETIKSNPTGMFKFEKDNVERYGWIQAMKRNDWTGMTTVKLLTNNASSPK